jgi:glucosamine--fructose-6-phosphate aminotransferase (isomerizing)
MCGIIAYKGIRNASEVVLKGLKSLEYRGYDSWGISVKKNSINTLKNIGRIGGVSLKDLNLPVSNIGIGHTRWATHGSVTEVNAHPHLSEDQKIAVVHNGIIENYQELRDFLKQKGIKFKSQTDTEIIPQYISFLMKQGKNFEDSTKEVLNNLEGSFAIVAINQESDELIGARSGSPLVLGVGDKEYFLASDVPAFLEFTKEVVYLDDDEIVIINDEYKVYNLKSNK